VGIFPEQAENWNYIQDCLSQLKGERKVLNLFAYTGAASIVAASCGATVTNVDSVKQVLNWGRENAEKNQLDNVRWILEDARKFVEKSLRRKDTYHGIIMDPPAFGFGTKNEKWKLEKDLRQLLEQSIQLLSKDQNFFILNTYSPKLSMDQLQKILKEMKHFPSEHEARILGLATPQKKVLGLGNLIRFKNQTFV
jgi:23S rRNA (cytosine1962-C5)-methyltransferase